MPVLVSDTSVIIDLDRAQLLEDMFGLQHEFVVPDLLFSKELAGELGDRLLARGLSVEPLTPQELVRVAEILGARKALSMPDTFAYVLAESRQWVLLTGDGGLRNLAVEENLPMHGVLWVLDQFHANALVENARLHAGLTAIHSHPRCRLPKEEVYVRLQQYLA